MKVQVPLNKAASLLSLSEFIYNRGQINGKDIKSKEKEKEK